ncbi:YncE family protein [Chitinophaga sp.]|uniref:YncE family protein n=1 Tax=Chitinophaga sp. TaxID=1869181 RepID=UPI0031CDE889
MMYRLLIAICLLAACRKGVTIPRVETQGIPGFQRAAPLEATAAGLYLLNEGNMNMNKASLDYLDLQTGQYHRRVFTAYNPEVTKGLGDVGNYIAIYGSMMYIVVNNSNKVEVVDAATCRRIKQLNVNQCRYVDFYKNKAYITSNDGYVAVVDTATLTIVNEIKTGRNPEQLVVAGSKLYVANSGGYSPPNYEKTISVIDLHTGQEIKRIEAGINLHRMALDAYGDLYVTSRGDYYTVPSRIYVIDTRTDTVKQTLEIAASNLFIHKDLAYIYSVEWSYLTGGNTISYTLLNVKNETKLDRNFIADGTEKNIRIPYGIAVDPDTDDVYVTDAKDYVTPGTLHCYDKTGKRKWSVMTGDIPAHFVFLKNK